MNEAFCMMGVRGGHDAWGWWPVALTSLISPLNTTSSALSLSIFSFISSWMASASCAAYGDGNGGGLRDARHPKGRRDLILESNQTGA